jgi:hypothetical protein
MTATSDDAIAGVRNDLDALRKDVSALVSTLDKSARANARNAADQFNGSVRGLSQSAVDGGQQSAKMLAGLVEEKPVLAFLLAVGVGYFGIRALLR